MKLKTDFENSFSVENLTKIFDEHISLSGGSGVDNLSIKAFELQKTEQLTIIHNKMIRICLKR